MKNRIIVVSVLLYIVGLLMIYSASSIWAQYKIGNEYYYLIRQTIFGVFGLIAMYVVSKIDIKYFKKYANCCFIIPLLMLILVLFIGTQRGGAKSWIEIGSILIQPSEFMKLGLIIFMAKFLSKNDSTKLYDFILALGIVGLVFGLIMLEPDFGSGFVITVGIIGLLIISGAKIKYFMALGIAGVVGIVGLILQAPYRIKRIIAFIDPWQDPLGAGFQSIQSLYAISPGGLFGYGYGNSRQKYYYLPEPQTDFIFAIIIEELGLIGGIVIFMLFLTLFITGFKIAIKQKDLFKCYLASGITIMLVVQFFINISVVIGLIPVTGVTLPFLSYGGSSLVITLLMMGILINIAKDENINNQ